MRVLLQKVVFNLPDVVEPEPIGELYLIEGVSVEVSLAGLKPRPRELVLIEDPEPHL
jgi:hypothetical protein